MKLISPRIPSAHLHGAHKVQSGALIEAGVTYDTAIALAFDREAYLTPWAVAGGHLAAISIDNCIGVTIEGTRCIINGSRHGILVADNSYNVWLDGVTFEGRSSGAEIVIGFRPFISPHSQWHSCGAVTLRDVKNTSGRPVRVSVWDAPDPIVIGGNVQVVRRHRRTVKAAKWLHGKGLLP